MLLKQFLAVFIYLIQTVEMPLVATGILTQQSSCENPPNQLVNYFYSLYLTVKTTPFLQFLSITPGVDTTRPLPQD